MREQSESDIERKVEWYNRECRGGDCNRTMGDMSQRVYCNDCLDRRLEPGTDRSGGEQDGE